MLICIPLHYTYNAGAARAEYRMLEVCKQLNMFSTSHAFWSCIDALIRSRGWWSLVSCFQACVVIDPPNRLQMTYRLDLAKFNIVLVRAVAVLHSLTIAQTSYGTCAMVISSYCGILVLMNSVCRKGEGQWSRKVTLLESLLSEPAQPASQPAHLNPAPNILCLPRQSWVPLSSRDWLLCWTVLIMVIFSLLNLNQCGCGKRVPGSHQTIG